MPRRERGTSPMPFDKYDQVLNALNNRENIVLIPQVQPQRIRHIPPFLRNLGLVGLGAGLGIAGYHLRHPLMKLGQKALNYTTDKFHRLFAPVNETNSSVPTQLAVRDGF